MSLERFALEMRREERDIDLYAAVTARRPENFERI